MSSFHLHCRLAQHVLTGAATLPRSAQNRERFNNVVFSSTLPPRWECAQGCRYASPVCKIERFTNVVFTSSLLSLHLHCCYASPVCTIQRFNNVVFSSPLPPRSICARRCRYASPVCKIGRFNYVVFANKKSFLLISSCSRYINIIFTVNISLRSHKTLEIEVYLLRIRIWILDTQKPRILQIRIQTLHNKGQ